MPNFKFTVLLDPFESISRVDFVDGFSNIYNFYRACGMLKV